VADLDQQVNQPLECKDFKIRLKF